MRRAGFVLVGGASSRMGRDKAWLAYRGRTLVEHVASEVLAAAGSATLVGPARRYGVLGYPIIPDRIPGCGPLGGIHAALCATRADWNLVVACDMPRLDRAFLAALLEEAEGSAGECLVPRSGLGQPEPLCAAWHRSALAGIGKALEEGVRKMTDALARFRTVYWPVSQVRSFANANTPQEWANHG